MEFGPQPFHFSPTTQLVNLDILPLNIHLDFCPQLKNVFLYMYLQDTSSQDEIAHHEFANTVHNPHSCEGAVCHYVFSLVLPCRLLLQSFVKPPPEEKKGGGGGNSFPLKKNMTNDCS